MYRYFFDSLIAGSLLIGFGGVPLVKCGIVLAQSTLVWGYYTEAM